MFGAWQAGVWSELAGRVQPDLIVGASVGSLNGYFVACGGSPEQLIQMWLDPKTGSRGRLRQNLLEMAHHRPRVPFALTMTDLLRMKPRIVRGEEVTWQHLAASCAVPLVARQVRIDGRLYSDGGLLNPLPVYAAVELGATRILGLNVLPSVPSAWLKPLILSFRWKFGIHPPVPEHVTLRVMTPSRRLGGMLDALNWKRENVAGWIEQGRQDAKNHFPSDLF